MRLLIAAVGRARAGAEKTLYDNYVRRLPWPVTLKEVEARGRMAKAQRRKLEAGLLLKTVPRGATVVALDTSGNPLTSEAFAEKIAAWRDQGVGDLAFLIGGADGHGAQVLERADYALSLGPMTWPHLLARVMLAEQLYRATSILAGHPYHRG